MVACGRLGDAALGQVVAGGRGLGGLPQVAGVEPGRVLQEPVQPAALGPPALVGRRGLLVLEPDAVAVRERLDSRGEVEALGLAHEGDVVAAALAAKAVVDLLHRVDRERRRALVVEGAPADEPGARPAQRRAPADEVHHVDCSLEGLEALAADRAHAADASAACARSA